MKTKILLISVLIALYCQITGRAQNCVNLAGQYNFTETTLLTGVGHGVTEQYTVVESGTITITQNGCSIGYQATQVSGDPRPFAGNGVGLTRFGTVVGNQIALSGTSFHPLTSQLRRMITTEQTSATGTINGNAIQIQGRGDVNTTVDIGIHFTWTSSATLNLIQTAPSIATQPADAAINAGTSVSFSVVAVGTGSLTYQWRRNGVNIPGATGAVLTLNNVTVDQAGDYSVVVANAAGSVTSRSARLTVSSAAPSGPVWTEDWEAAALGTYIPKGADLVFITSAKNKWALSDTASSFEKEHGPTPNQAQILVQDGSKALKLMSNLRADRSSSGNIYVGLLSAVSPISLPITAKTRLAMTETGALVNPQSAKGFSCIMPPCADTVHFDLVDNRGNQVTYIWQRPSNYTEHTVASLASTSRGYTEVFLPMEGGRVERDLFADFSRIPGWLPNNASVVQIGFMVDDTGWATLDNLKIGEFSIAAPPSVTTQPASCGVKVGETATFSVAAAGTPPLQYQWRFNGVDIPGATNAALILSSLTTGQAGLYTVTVRNPAGSVTSQEARLTVIEHIIAPPGKPLATELTTTNATVGWTASIDSFGHPLHYELQYWNAADITQSFVVQRITNAWISLTGLQPDTAYATVVKGIDDGNASSPWSEKGSFKTPPIPLTAPGRPIATQITSSSARISWDGSISAQGGAVRYEVQYWNSADMSEYFVLPDITNAWLILTGLKPSTDYGLVLKAVDSEGLSSDWSSRLEFQTAAAVPLRLTIGWGNGFPQLTITGEPNRSCAVESTLVLGGQAAWQSVTNVSLGAGTVSITDTSHDNARQVFYRARLGAF